MANLALEDVKLLDFTQGITGPFCTKQMSDLGADVIKVERPDGGDLHVIEVLSWLERVAPALASRGNGDEPGGPLRPGMPPGPTGP